MTELTLETLRAELAPLRAQLDAMAPHVDGVPLIGAAIETLRHDFRMMRAALNDMARVNVTAGEIEALHADQSDLIDLGARLATVERLLREAPR
jgi:hypothetical protein